jgi:defect-in-organelle-trafficking protein DotC
MASDKGKPALKVYLENLTSDRVKKQSGADDFATGVRNKILKTEAFSLGVQGGRYWANQRIEKYLSPFSEELSKIADFSSVVIPVGDFIMLPPVIAEVNYQSQISNDKRTIHSVGQTFKIKQNPRFVYNVPSWNDYIYFNPRPVELGHHELHPENKEEARLWKDNVDKGWKSGVETAYESLEVKIARLVSDLDGMRRYHIMRSKRMVTEPIFDKSSLPIRGGGLEMRIDNIKVSVQVSPKLNSQIQNWEAIPRMPDIKSIFPKGIPRFYE